MRCGTRLSPSRHLAVLAMLFVLGTATARAEVQDLRLSIINESDRPLRCVAVIAHFMSQSWDAVTPGERLLLWLERDTNDGSLFLRSAGGRRKPIENLQCGASDDWAATRGEVPLIDLRTLTPRDVELTCRLDRHVVCDTVAAGD